MSAMSQSCGTDDTDAVFSMLVILCRAYLILDSWNLCRDLQQSGFNNPTATASHHRNLEDEKGAIWIRMLFFG